MLTIEVTCNRCGLKFAPNREAFTKGGWHTCPACQGDPATQVSEARDTDSSRSQERAAHRNHREDDPCAV